MCHLVGIKRPPAAGPRHLLQAVPGRSAAGRPGPTGMALMVIRYAHGGLRFYVSPPARVVSSGRQYTFSAKTSSSRSITMAALTRTSRG